jgi:hypothetical protein
MTQWGSSSRASSSSSTSTSRTSTGCERRRRCGRTRSQRCRQILTAIVEETGILREKTAEHRRQLKKELEDVEKRLRKWHEAFETGDKLAAKLGAERVVELKARRDELQQTLHKVVALRPPPPNLYTEASIERFQRSIRSIFLSGDNGLTKSYLRFLVDKTVVNGPHVQLHTRPDAVVQMMAAGGAALPDPAAGHDGAHSRTSVADWLPGVAWRRTTSLARSR